MDFTKLASIFEEGGIFFSRSDMLGDTFEGSYSQANADYQIRSEVYEEDCKRLNIPIEKMIEAHRTFRKVRKWQRQWMMISCWHMSEHESAAMWKLYTKSNESVCIQSTYRKFANVLTDNVYIGQVQYIDYSKEWIGERNLYTPYMHKRKSFEHEREIRAIDNQSPKGPLPMDRGISPPDFGVWHNINLRELIERIYIAPSSPLWFRDLVKKFTVRYGFDIDVIKSSLDDEPFY
ncbi:MAG: hypothetical protein K9K63_00790 [Desulfotignum sp.]|nr:hypothetical protein [Desulfotignum sp.]